jgi:hypothetical protein
MKHMKAILLCLPFFLSCSPSRQQESELHAGNSELTVPEAIRNEESNQTSLIGLSELASNWYLAATVLDEDMPIALKIHGQNMGRLVKDERIFRQNLANVVLDNLSKYTSSIDAETLRNTIDLRLTSVAIDILSTHSSDIVQALDSRAAGHDTSGFLKEQSNLSSTLGSSLIVNLGFDQLSQEFKESFFTSALPYLNAILNLTYYKTLSSEHLTRIRDNISSSSAQYCKQGFTPGMKSYAVPGVCGLTQTNLSKTAWQKYLGAYESLSRELIALRSIPHDQIRLISRFGSLSQRELEQLESIQSSIVVSQREGISWGDDLATYRALVDSYVTSLRKQVIRRDLVKKTTDSIYLDSRLDDAERSYRLAQTLLTQRKQAIADSNQTAQSCIERDVLADQITALRNRKNEQPDFFSQERRQLEDDQLAVNDTTADLEGEKNSLAIETIVKKEEYDQRIKGYEIDFQAFADKIAQTQREFDQKEQDLKSARVTLQKNVCIANKTLNLLSLETEAGKLSAGRISDSFRDIIAEAQKLSGLADSMLAHTDAFYDEKQVMLKTPLYSDKALQERNGICAAIQPSGTSNSSAASTPKVLEEYCSRSENGLPDLPVSPADPVRFQSDQIRFCGASQQVITIEKSESHITGLASNPRDSRSRLDARAFCQGSIVDAAAHEFCAKFKFLDKLVSAEANTEWCNGAAIRPEFTELNNGNNLPLASYCQSSATFHDAQQMALIDSTKVEDLSVDLCDKFIDKNDPVCKMLQKKTHYKELKGQLHDLAVGFNKNTGNRKWKQQSSLWASVKHESLPSLCASVLDNSCKQIGENTVLYSYCKNIYAGLNATDPSVLEFALPAKPSPLETTINQTEANRIAFNKNAYWPVPVDFESSHLKTSGNVKRIPECGKVSDKPIIYSICFYKMENPIDPERECRVGFSEAGFSPETNFFSKLKEDLTAAINEKKTLASATSQANLNAQKEAIKAALGLEIENIALSLKSMSLEAERSKSALVAEMRLAGMNLRDVQKSTKDSFQMQLEQFLLNNEIQSLGQQAQLIELKAQLETIAVGLSRLPLDRRDALDAIEIQKRKLHAEKDLNEKYYQSATGGLLRNSSIGTFKIREDGLNRRLAASKRASARLDRDLELLEVKQQLASTDLDNQIREYELRMKHWSALCTDKVNKGLAPEELGTYVDGYLKTSVQQANAFLDGLQIALEIRNLYTHTEREKLTKWRLALKSVESAGNKDQAVLNYQFILDGAPANTNLPARGLSKSWQAYREDLLRSTFNEGRVVSLFLLPAKNGRNDSGTLRLMQKVDEYSQNDGTNTSTDLYLDCLNRLPPTQPSSACDKYLDGGDSPLADNLPSMPALQQCVQDRFLALSESLDSKLLAAEKDLACKGNAECSGKITAVTWKNIRADRSASNSLSWEKDNNAPASLSAGFTTDNIVSLKRWYGSRLRKLAELSAQGYSPARAQAMNLQRMWKAFKYYRTVNLYLAMVRELNSTSASPLTPVQTGIGFSLGPDWNQASKGSLVTGVNAVVLGSGGINGRSNYPAEVRINTREVVSVGTEQGLSLGLPGETRRIGDYQDPVSSELGNIFANDSFQDSTGTHADYFDIIPLSEKLRYHSEVAAAKMEDFSGSMLGSWPVFQNVQVNIRAAANQKVDNLYFKGLVLQFRLYDFGADFETPTTYLQDGVGDAIPANSNVDRLMTDIFIPSTDYKVFGDDNGETSVLQWLIGDGSITSCNNFESSL